MENGVCGEFNEVLERIFEVVWMIDPVHIVCFGGDFEGWRWNRPHEICGVDPRDEQVVSVNRYGRFSIAKGDQQEGTGDLTSGQVVKV